MEITKGRVLEMWRALTNIQQRAQVEKYPVRFIYGVEKNVRVLKTEVEAVQAAIAQATKPSEKYEEYDKARVVLCEELCNKDDDGKPIERRQPNGASEYVFSDEAMKELDEKVKELEKEHPEAIEERENRQKDIRGLLDEEVEIELQRIKIGSFPEMMVGHEVRLLFDIIDDE